WLAEADVHLRLEDPFGVLTNVRALEVGVAVFTRDFDAAAAALRRLHEAVAAREPLPPQRLHVERAEGWAARLRNEADAGRQLLAAAAAFADMPALAAALAYEARRAGAPAATELEALAARCESRLLSS